MSQIKKTIYLILFSAGLFVIQASHATTDKELNNTEKQLQLNNSIFKIMKQKLLLMLPVKLSCVPSVKGGIGLDKTTKQWLPLNNSITSDAFTAQISIPNENHKYCILRSKEITPDDEARKIELKDGSIVCLSQYFLNPSNKDLYPDLNDTPCQVKYGILSNDLYFVCNNKTLVFYGFSEYFISTGISGEEPAVFGEIIVEKGSCTRAQ